MRKRPLLPLLLLMLGSAIPAQSPPLNVPPVANGGLLGLQEQEHLFIESTYGAFELLSYANAPWAKRPTTVTPQTWKLTTMGNYLDTGLQFATLARLEAHPDGALLIVFAWKAPQDTLTGHGVLFHTFLEERTALLRTRQSGTGVRDTLEIACSETGAICARGWFDTASGRVHLHRTVQKEYPLPAEALPASD